MFNLSIELVYIVPAALLAIMLHESAHGLVSYWLGDPTPKAQGRISLNIFKHIDILGTLSLIFFGFGWAKPVQINPRYYKNVRLGTALVALAGPFVNFIIAFLAMFVCGIIAKTAGYDLTGFLYHLNLFFYYLSVINVGLGVFNLIPFPPLDGSKVVLSFLPEKSYVFVLRYEYFGMIALIVLLYMGVLDAPLGTLHGWALEAISSAVAFILNL